MKSVILLTLILLSASSSVLAQNDSSGISEDPRLRAAYFNARTHKPFDALAAFAEAQKQSGKLAISSELKVALQAAVSELNVDLTDLATPLVSLIKHDSGQMVNDAIYDNYNLGVSLLKSNTPLAGVEVLREITAGEYIEIDHIFLKDKTNLILGYYLAETGDQFGAIDHFRQVRRLSIYANRALVGLGWAMLSPNTTLEKSASESTNVYDTLAGDYLWSGSDDDIAWSRRESPFRRAGAIAKGEKEEDLLAAMVPWMELLSRDTLDPAVQEVMLIIPYVMLHWDGQVARSEQYYISAIDRLKHADAELAFIEKDIRSGGLVKNILGVGAQENNGWDIWLSDLTASRTTGYLKLLLDAPGFHQALAELRQLDLIHARLKSAIDDTVLDANSSLRSAQLDDARALARTLLAEIDKHRSHRSEALENLALLRIGEYRRRTEAYSAEAEFALARSYERLRSQLLDVVWSENES
tara:strand:- start:9495 stop:10904 length:1410 start_codon:yes stop_codon:yes gene_type:complete